MQINIREYDPVRDYDKLLEIIGIEGDEWKEYLQPIYRDALADSISYVALVDKEVCGYSRSKNDSGIFIWVIDLLVQKEYRGLSLGKKLLECIIADYPGLDVYVMSDVDGYYQKLGYKNEGSIFKVQRK